IRRTRPQAWPPAKISARTGAVDAGIAFRIPVFIRVLFLLLLALNIGAACWLYFTPRESSAELPAADAGVPKLVLLSENEHDAIAGNAEMASPPETRADLKQDVCASLGPVA